MKSFTLFWTLLTAIVWLNSARASELPVSGIDSTQAGFEHMDDAAADGVKAAIASSNINEFAGAVYKKDGKFFHTIPVTQNSDGGVDYRIQMPAGAKLVAIFHTHGTNGNDSEYSFSDIKTARDMNLLMYIGVIRTGVMMKYDPSRDNGVYSVSHSTGFQGQKQIRL